MVRSLVSVIGFGSMLLILDDTLLRIAPRDCLQTSMHGTEWSYCEHGINGVILSSFSCNDANGRRANPRMVPLVSRQ